MKYFLIIFSLLSILHANDELQFLNEKIDDTHKVISRKLLRISEYIDQNICQFSNDEHNCSKCVDDRNQLDKFFQNDRYLEDIDDTYLRINTSYLQESKNNESSSASIRARIPLNRTKKRFKLFIRDQNEDPNSVDPAQVIGIDYFLPKRYNISSKYSIGTRGFHPYVRARFYSIFDLGEWVIEPIQSFRYSVKTKFQEQTSLFIDKRFEDLSLFRLLLQRETQEDMDGMNYNINLSYITLFNKFGVNFLQSFSGNTKYKEVQANHTRIFSGIHNYSSSLSFRKNIWKKWLFYEFVPGVNFHRQNDYEANYSIRFTLSIYLGKYTGV